MNNEINIEVLGPGWWMKIHRDAVRATTEERKRCFEYNMVEDCDTFPCAKCKTHLRTFIDNHPLKNYWYIKDNKGHDIGFFKWTWELHNQVNQRLKKYQPTLEEAYGYYTESAVNACFNCNTNDNNNEFYSMSIPPILTSYLEKKQQQRILDSVSLISNVPTKNNKSIVKHL
jgi:hypothetical protein